MESKAFRDRNASFTDLGVQVYGASDDPLPAQKKFLEKFGFEYPLLAGAGKDLCEAFGAVGGKRRVTFLFDAEGTCRRVWSSVSPADHAEEVLEACRELFG